MEATATERETTKKNYKEDTIVFKNFTIMEEMLKTYIQDAVQDIYLQPIKNKYTGYLGVGARDMMDHVMDQYGKITLADIVNNNTQFQEEITMDQQTDAYFSAIDNSLQYALGVKAPYSTKYIMVHAENAICKTGLYREAPRKWKAKAQTDKTWDDFKNTLQRNTTKQGG
eukprot:12799578-Ditylum_brightwellii.AAC.1